MLLFLAAILQFFPHTAKSDNAVFLLFVNCMRLNLVRPKMFFTFAFCNLWPDINVRNHIPEVADM